MDVRHTTKLCKPVVSKCTHWCSSDANAILIPKPIADEAMDAASCIGCGACVAACKNGSAMLFVSAKVSRLNLLPQGKPEALRRAKAMLSKMDELGFGNCTNTVLVEVLNVRRTFPSAILHVGTATSSSQN